MKIRASCIPEASGMARDSVEGTHPTGGDVPDIRRDMQSNGTCGVPGVTAAARYHRGLDPVLSRGFVGLRRNLIPDSVARVRRLKQIKNSGVEGQRRAAGRPNV
jgi:hypothetical protein